MVQVLAVSFVPLISFATRDLCPIHELYDVYMSVKNAFGKYSYL
jgi:hypothetical protein